MREQARERESESNLINSESVNISYEVVLSSIDNVLVGFLSEARKREMVAHIVPNRTKR